MSYVKELKRNRRHLKLARLSGGQLPRGKNSKPYDCKVPVERFKDSPAFSGKRIRNSTKDKRERQQRSHPSTHNRKIARNR